jgi:hypothetical protein
MEVDPQRLFGLQDTFCEQLNSLAETPQPPPPHPPYWDSYTRALLVSKDGRHLSVTRMPTKLEFQFVISLPLSNIIWDVIHLVESIKSEFFVERSQNVLGPISID